MPTTETQPSHACHEHQCPSFSLSSCFTSLLEHQPTTTLIPPAVCTTSAHPFQYLFNTINMVQFKRTGYTPRGECRDYWKLTPVVGMRAFLLESLEQKGVKHPKGLSKARLSCISLRVQRGLMVYDSCGVSDLRSFAATRKLNIPDLNRCKKWDLVAHLEKADEEATFT